MPQNDRPTGVCKTCISENNENRLLTPDCQRKKKTRMGHTYAYECQAFSCYGTFAPRHIQTNQRASMLPTAHNKKTQPKDWKKNGW
jgi:hypothetical protein